MAKQTKKQGPKAVAMQDIMIELHKEGKCFIAFRTELNAPIRLIVREHIKEQKERR